MFRKVVKNLLRKTPLYRYLVNKIASKIPSPDFLTTLKNFNQFLVNEQERKRSSICRGMPTYLFIDINSLCDLKCKMCFFHSGLQKLTWPKGEMDIELFRKIAEEAFPYVTSVGLGGTGEPLISKNLAEMLQICNQYKVKVDINTNGTLLTAEKIKILLGAKVLNNLIVSFDGAKKETLETIRIGSNLDKLLGNIKTFNKFRSSLPTSERPNLVFSVTLMRQNIEELLDLLRIFKSVEADSVLCFPLGVYFPEIKQESLFYHKDLANFYLEEARKVGKELNLPVCLPAPFPNGSSEALPGPSDSSSTEVVPCAWLWRGLWIANNGDIAPCCSGSFDKPILGRIGLKSIEEMWNCQTYQEMRQRLDTDDPFPCCKNCDLIEVMTGQYNESSFIQDRWT